MHFKILCVIAVLSANLSAQGEWERWSAKEPVYQIHTSAPAQTKPVNKSGILDVLKKGYSFFISDLDGDNCPFSPTCSEFFVTSSKMTNIFQGALMFADRFTRDINPAKPGLYPVTESGRYYDPPENHLLQNNRIILIEDFYK